MGCACCGYCTTALRGHGVTGSRGHGDVDPLRYGVTQIRRPPAGSHQADSTRRTPADGPRQTGPDRQPPMVGVVRSSSTAWVEVGDHQPRRQCCGCGCADLGRTPGVARRPRGACRPAQGGRSPGGLAFPLVWAAGFPRVCGLPGAGPDQWGTPGTTRRSDVLGVCGRAGGVPQREGVTTGAGAGRLDRGVYRCGHRVDPGPVDPGPVDPGPVDPAHRVHPLPVHPCQFTRDGAAPHPGKPRGTPGGPGTPGTPRHTPRHTPVHRPAPKGLAPATRASGHTPPPPRWTRSALPGLVVTTLATRRTRSTPPHTTGG